MRERLKPTKETDERRKIKGVRERETQRETERDRERERQSEKESERERSWVQMSSTLASGVSGENNWINIFFLG